MTMMDLDKTRPPYSWTKTKQEHCPNHKNGQTFPCLANRSHSSFFANYSYSRASLFSSSREDVFLRYPIKALLYFLIASNANPSPTSLNPSPNRLIQVQILQQVLSNPFSWDASWFSMVRVLFQCNTSANPFVPSGLWLEGIDTR